MWAELALNQPGGTLDYCLLGYCLLVGLLNDKRASRGAPASAKEVDRLQRLPGLAANRARTVRNSSTPSCRKGRASKRLRLRRCCRAVRI